MCMAPFSLGLRNLHFNIDVPELFEGRVGGRGAALERTKRSANSYWPVAAEVHTRTDESNLIRDRVKD